VHDNVRGRSLETQTVDTDGGASKAGPSYLFPADCRTGQILVSPEAMVRLCSADTGRLVTHVWMRRDRFGERVLQELKPGSSWRVGLLASRAGVYLQVGVELFHLGRGRWDSVVFPPTFDPFFVDAVDNDGRLLSVREGNVFRLSADHQTEEQIIVAPTAAGREPGDLPPTYLSGGSRYGDPMGIGERDFGLDGVSVRHVFVAEDDTLYAVADSRNGSSFILSSKAAGPVRVLLSRLDQAAVLANMEQPVPVTEPCQEMFVPIERAPVAPNETAQLAKALEELANVQTEWPRSLRAVAGRLHGKPVLGFILVGTEQYEFARAAAEHFAANPAQPPAVSCTLPELRHAGR
jgi:hypothetical protein